MAPFGKTYNQRMGPAAKRLADALDAVTDVRPLVDPALSTQDNLVNIRQKKYQISLDTDKCQRYLASVHQIDTDWTTFITSITDDTARDEDQTYYQSVVDSVRSFTTVVTRAEDRLAHLAALTQEVRDTLRRLEAEQTAQAAAAVAQLQAPPAAAPDNPPVAGGLAALSQLPKIRPTPFAGDPATYKDFADQFEVQVASQPISNCLKFHYLRQFLRGPAAAAIAGIAVTDDNYELAMRTLKERFGDPAFVKDALFASLRKLRKPANNSISELRATYVAMEKILNQLEALGEDLEQSLLIGFIQDLIPDVHLIKLDEQYKDLTAGTGDWTVSELRSALKRLIHVQERVERRGTVASNTAPVKHGTTPQYTNTSALVATTDAKTNKPSGGFRKKTKGPPKVKCFMCDGGHYSNQCQKYNDITQRKNRLFELHRCFKCLQVDCRAATCTTQTKPCYHCKQMTHPSMLCTAKHSNGENSNRKSVPVLIAPDQRGHLLTAKATATHPLEKEKRAEVTLLLDSGSQRTFINEKLARTLQLPIDGVENLVVNRFGTDETTGVSSNKVHLTLLNREGEPLNISASTVEVITSPMHYQPLPEQDQLVLDQEQLANPEIMDWGHAAPEILVGQDYLWQIVRVAHQQQLPSGLITLPSKFGLLVGGSSEVELTTTSLQLQVAEELPKLTLDSMWRLESLGITDDPLQDDDKLVWQKFANSITQDKEGRFVAELPWKDNHSPLASGFGQAFGRLKSLLVRLQDNKELLKAEDEIFQQQEKDGVIEEVTNDMVEGERVVYLPHHQIIKSSSDTTKVRVVFDGKAATGKDRPSLNACLMKGEPPLPDLAALLMKFQTKPVAIVADLERAFLQVGLAEKDRDATRFLWLRKVDEPVSLDNLKIYRFKRIPFGLVSSPFILGATIHHLLVNHSEEAKQVAEHCYVDNVLYGVSSTEEAMEFYHKYKAIFGDVKMNLREWSSNDQQFINSLPEADRVPKTTVKLLGLKWNTEKDTLQINRPEIGDSSETKILSKRQVLKDTASVYDPLGMVAPVVVTAKMFLQKLWKHNLQWDDQLSADLAMEWIQLRNELKMVDQVIRPRFFGADPNHTTNQLITFADASAGAYGCVTFIRMVEENGTTTIRQLWAKSKLAPPKEKKLTLPRLELMALRIAVRATEFVTKQLNVIIAKTFLYSDSQCVLKWLTTSKPLKVFVANAVKEIKSHEDYTFGYVRSEDNPADCLSRGVTMQELLDHQLWWTGPPWLKLPMNDWPTNDFEEITQETWEQVKAEIPPIHQMVAGEVIAENDVPSQQLKPGIQLLNVHRFSTLNKLHRTMAYVHRFLKIKIWNQLSANTKDKHQWWKHTFDKVQTSGLLNAAEIKMAQLTTEMQVQRSALAETLDAVIQNTPDKIKDSLKVRLDTVGLLRCHGRLGNANLSYTAKHPVLLPKKHHYTTLIVEDQHRKSLHSGVAHTLASIRNTHWIPHGRQVVTKVLQQCIICKRYTGGPFKMPTMPDLPLERITNTRPFENTALDYIGPINVQSNNDKTKVWICLFTCMVSRAVHLELVPNLTAEGFLHALRRFIARRSKPALIYSDNAPTFKLVHKTTQLLPEQEPELDSEVANYLATQQIQWKYMVQYASWMGGVFERMVGLVKSNLRKTIGHRLLQREELHTLLTEVEAIVNSRPLTYIEAQDSTSARILRPLDLLGQFGSTQTPNLEDTRHEDDYTPTLNSQQKLLQYWAHSQSLLERFWKLWQEDYLLSLRERYKTDHHNPRIHQQTDPQLGEMVLIKEEHSPRGCWKVGRISKLNQSKDGLIRSAEVVMPNKQKRQRPIGMLYPLEVGYETEDGGDKDVEPTQQKSAADVQTLQTDNKERSPPMTRARAQRLQIKVPVLLFLLVLVRGMFAQSMKCKKPLTGSNFVSDDCVNSGMVVRKINNSYCWYFKECGAAKHLNGRGTCGRECPCADWASSCLHTKVKDLPIKQTDLPIDSMLEDVRPNICSFKQDSRCSSISTTTTMNQIELLDNRTILVDTLSIKITEKTR